MYSQNLPLLQREGHALGRKKKIICCWEKKDEQETRKNIFVLETTMVCSPEVSFVNTQACFSRICVFSFMSSHLRDLSVNHKSHNIGGKTGSRLDW